MTWGPKGTYDGDSAPLYTERELRDHKRKLLRQRARASGKLRAIIDVELDHLDNLLKGY